jgi:DNA-binding transcriptional regulator YhcF (GntR family)
MRIKARHILAQAPTNFADPASENAADERKKYERYGVQLKAHLDEQKKVFENERFVKLLEKVAGKTGEIGKAVTQFKDAKAQKELADDQEFENKLLLDPYWVANSTDIAKFKRLQYLDKRNQIIEGTDEDKELDALAARFDESERPEAAHYIWNASGRNQVIINEMLARDSATGLTEAELLQDDRWGSIVAPGFKQNNLTRYSEAETDSKTREALFLGWRKGRLDHLNLKNEALIGILGDEITRQTQTARTGIKAKARQAITDQEDLKVYSVLKTAAATGSFEDALFTVRASFIARSENPNIKKGLGIFKEYKGEDGKTVTVNQQVDKYLKQTIEDLVSDGYISRSQIVGYLETGIDHPAGVKGKGTPRELYYKPEEIKDLLAKADVGSERHLGVQTTHDFNLLATARERAVRGEDVTETLNKLRNRGLIPKEQIDDVDIIDVKNNTQEATARARLKLQAAKNEGFYGRSKEDFTEQQMPNDEVRQEALKLFGQLDDPTHGSKSQKGSIDDLIADGGNVPWEGDNRKLTGMAALIARDIDRLGEIHRSQLVWSQYDANGNFIEGKRVPDIDGQVAIYKQGLWTAGGGGIKDKTSKGIYAYNIETGDFTNYRNSIGIPNRIPNTFRLPNRGVTDHMKTTAQNNLLTNYYKDGVVDYKKWIADGPLSDGEVLTILSTGDTTDYMEYLAGLGNTSVMEILETSLARIKKYNPDLYRAQNLDDASKDARKQNALMKSFDKLWQKFDDKENIQALTTRDLKFLLKKGFHRLTPNQLARVRLTLADKDTGEQQAREAGLQTRIQQQITDMRKAGKSEEEITAWLKSLKPTK